MSDDPKVDGQAGEQWSDRRCKDPERDDKEGYCRSSGERKKHIHELGRHTNANSAFRPHASERPSVKQRSQSENTADTI